MNYSVRIKEFNQAGETVRDKTLMKTANKQRALSFYHQKVDNLRHAHNGRSELLAMNGDEVMRRFEY